MELWKHRMEELFEEAYNQLVDSGHLEGELACGHLNGEWMSLESDGYVGAVQFVHGLVYGVPFGPFGSESYYAGSEYSGLPFLEYVETDFDGYFVFERGNGDRVRAKQVGDTLEWSDGAVYYDVRYFKHERLDYAAISGGETITVAGARVQVFLGGDTYESFSGDGTFFGGDANVGGDNDEKYEEDLDFSIAEASPATCESDPVFGTSFANVNIERVFLYFHYEFVKRDFG